MKTRQVELASRIGRSFWYSGELYQRFRRLGVGKFDNDDPFRLWSCADLWAELERRALERATSVGAFMEQVNEAVADQLEGALLSFQRE